MANKKISESETTRTGAEHGECFVIMPISDPDGYTSGHFRRVYEDIFKPAITAAGFEPKRADDVLETNLIQLDLLRRLLEAPMAICDLSSRNPNVLFELGLRQAFDKPVAIVQEEGTPKIFDISPLRFTPYRRNRVYHEVLEDQTSITAAIDATRRAALDPANVNSLVRLLGFTQPATLVEIQAGERDPAMQLVHAELAEMRRDLGALVRGSPAMSPVRSVDASVARKLPLVRSIVLQFDLLDPTVPLLAQQLERRLDVRVIWSKTMDPESLVLGYNVEIEFEAPQRLSRVVEAISSAAESLALDSVPSFRVLAKK